MISRAVLTDARSGAGPKSRRGAEARRQ